MSLSASFSTKVPFKMVVSLEDAEVSLQMWHIRLLSSTTYKDWKFKYFKFVLLRVLTTSWILEYQNGVRLKQRIRFPLFERLFRRISVLRVTSRRGGWVLCYTLAEHYGERIRCFNRSHQNAPHFKSQSNSFLIIGSVHTDFESQLGNACVNYPLRSMLIGIWYKQELIHRFSNQFTVQLVLK